MKYLPEGVKSNYNKYPTTVVAGKDNEAWQGYKAIAQQIGQQLNKSKNIVTVDCTIGVNQAEVVKGFQSLNFSLVLDSTDIFYDSETMNQMLARYVTEDRVFGIAYYGKWMDFVDPKKLAKAQQAIEKASGNVLIVGVAASYIHHGDILVFADMTIWEIQMRYRKGLDNFNAKNYHEEQGKKFKRGYFVDWRLSNVHKKTLFTTFDYYLDTVLPDDPRMITRSAFEEGLKQMLTQPFRTVPFFDEGLWGGQWMKEVVDVEDKDRINYAWSYNCLFPENEVNLSFQNIRINVPGYTVCLRYPKQLIGEKGFARFGADYPIRFDFLDTMEGGNLSLQVHPDTEFFHENFAMPYTQDESYYFLDCYPSDTYMYLGLTDEANRADMERDLKAAERGEISFPAEKYANKLAVKKHEHYHIPAGTVHCSGANTMVLEISSAPCIFTFKLWDWGRVGLDGKPRPINIDRGMQVIQWDKHTDWIKKNCAFAPVLLESGDGWREERTGLQEYEFIETRRYWQTKQTLHKTNNETQVLNLVEGREALIESTHGQFAPYVMHYAESIVIPAEIDEYTITPCGESEGKEIGVIKAYVRF